MDIFLFSICSSIKYSKKANEQLQLLTLLEFSGIYKAIKVIWSTKKTILAHKKYNFINGFNTT